MKKQKILILHCKENLLSQEVLTAYCRQYEQQGHQVSLQSIDGVVKDTYLYHHLIQYATSISQSDEVHIFVGGATDWKNYFLLGMIFFEAYLHPQKKISIIQDENAMIDGQLLLKFEKNDFEIMLEEWEKSQHEKNLIQNLKIAPCE